jgi:putative endonuclease
MPQQSYYTYIMASSSRVLYIGVTNNLERRVAQHKEETIKGFTTISRCHRLVWYERYSWIGQAIAREKELKGWLRARKVVLIQEQNRTWVDLSEEWSTQIKPCSKSNKKRILPSAGLRSG